MAKKNGALFSRALFGYKRKDVVEYIRTVDVDHADELSRINSENESLQKKLDASEMLCKELENKLAQEKAFAQESQKKLTLEYEKKLANLNNAVNLQKDKLNDSESRASSYLKLIDSASMRAESAEAELTVGNALEALHGGCRASICEITDEHNRIELFVRGVAPLRVRVSHIEHF